MLCQLPSRLIGPVFDLFLYILQIDSLSLVCYPFLCFFCTALETLHLFLTFFAIGVHSLRNGMRRIAFLNGRDTREKGRIMGGYGDL